MKGEMIETISSSEAMTALTKAECDLQIQTAHTFPRDLQRLKENSMSIVTADQQTASDMFYALPRGGKSIEGPSVRLAEVVASTYGNLRVQSMITAMDGKFVTARGMCHDLENNLAVSVDVRRRITDRNGKRYNDDMIVTTSNAACAVAYREAVFKVVPRHFTNALYEEARQVAIGDVRSLANKRAAMVLYFSKMGVTVEQLCQVVGAIDEEGIGLGELATLKGIATALKDNEASIDDVFAAPAKVTAKEPAEKKLSAGDLLASQAVVGADNPSVDDKPKRGRPKGSKNKPKEEEFSVADELLEKAKNMTRLDEYDSELSDDGAVTHAMTVLQDATTEKAVVDFVGIVLNDEAYSNHDGLHIATLACERLKNLESQASLPM